MIYIDNVEIPERVMMDKPFACCFMNENKAYRCFVHSILPTKRIFEIVVNDNGKTEKEAEVDNYEVYWHALSTLCQSKDPNTEENRSFLINNIIPVEWKLVDSSMYTEENQALKIRDFLINKLGGELCEIKALHDVLGTIDGEIELKS